KDARGLIVYSQLLCEELASCILNIKTNFDGGRDASSSKPCRGCQYSPRQLDYPGDVFTMSITEITSQRSPRHIHALDLRAAFKLRSEFRLRQKNAFRKSQRFVPFWGALDAPNNCLHSGICIGPPGES
uniref:UDENN domain-containing protein n=1 Tax=Mesocestoides corti TaxID=53468 RepID=A0A5K3F8H4_MESCO